MTERKLWNGWNKPKALKWFFIGYLVLNIVLWIREAETFDSYNSFSDVRTESGILEDEEDWLDVPWENLTELLQEANSVIGIVFAVIFMAGVAVIAIHRESFRENWDLTLRRVPRYRGKYLFSKIVAVLIPAVGYMVYYGTQWLYRFYLYQKEIQQQYDYFMENQKSYKIKYVLLDAKEFLSVVPIKPILEMSLYTVLMALILLLLSFSVRRIKKDVMGFCAAIAGLVALVILFSGVFAFPRAVEIAILSVDIGIILFFNIRHVYVKW